MSLSNEMATKAMNYGKPVSTKWISENGGSSHGAAACAKNWMSSPLYECTMTVIDGVKHYLVTSVRVHNDKSKDMDLVKEIDRMINTEGLTIPQTASRTGASTSTVNRLIRTYKIRKSNKKSESERKRIAQKSYETVKRKKEAKHATIIEEYRNNSECLLWGVALGYNMGTSE